MSTSTKNAHLATTTESDPRWAAVVARDPQATFFYSVKTTGVYCRPSCAARLARPENVRGDATVVKPPPSTLVCSVPVPPANGVLALPGMEQ